MYQCPKNYKNPVVYCEGFCVLVLDKILEANEPYIFRLHFD